MKKGLKGHGFEPVIAADKNATTIHHQTPTGEIKGNSLVLFDIGAEVENYSADISRTYAVSRATPRQKAVYRAVIATQEYAYSLLKPGVKLREYEAEVDKFMAKQLKGLDLLEDETDKRRLKKFYPHLTTHHLGLDTHDSADYDMPLEAGMVLTVEPGIYIPEETIGIRIEDDVLITETGIEVLSKDIDSSFVVQ